MKRYQLLTIGGFTIFIISFILIDMHYSEIVYAPPELVEDLSGFFISSQNVKIIGIMSMPEKQALEITITAQDDGILYLSHPLTYLQDLFQEKSIESYAIIVDGIETSYDLKKDHIEIKLKKHTKVIEIVGFSNLS